MPIVHHAAYSSNSSPSHPRSSKGCSLLVCLMFQFDRLSRDGTELQHCAQLHVWPGTAERSCPWSVTLCHLWPFGVFQTLGISLLGTSFWSAWHRWFSREVLQPIWTHSPLLPKYIQHLQTLGMVPWSLSPRCQTAPLGGCSWVALHPVHWCFHVSGI